MKWLHTGKKFENKWQKKKIYQCQISKEVLTFILHREHFLNLFSRYSEEDTVGKQLLMSQEDHKSDIHTPHIYLFWWSHTFFLQLN